VRLLYVDDDRINTLLFEEACRLVQGIEVHTATDGAEAVEIAGQAPPEALVLDLHLPDTDGCALLARLRGLPGLAAAPAFLCSAEDPDALRVRAHQAGFAACWSKPVDPVMLVQHLGALRGSL
jgi:CheY-like chemotaxis protein